MQNRLIILFFFLVSNIVFAQKAFTKYLENALIYAEKKDSEKFNDNINLFKAATDKSKLSPSNLEKNETDLFTRALNIAIINKLNIAKELSSLIYEFLVSDPSNIRNKVSLAFILQKGEVIPKDLFRAIKLFKEADLAGHPKAAFSLGYLYQYDLNNLEEARKWYLLAAVEKKDKDAMLALASLYSLNTSFQDFKKSFFWYTELLNIDTNNAIASLNLGVLYLNGTGVEQNLSKSTYWLEKAANNGNYLAYTFLGMIYFQGKLEKVDYEKAFEYYYKAAELQEPFAMHLLGYAFEKGQGVEQDINKAIYWYDKAVKLNYTDAKNSLGVIYYRIKKVDNARKLLSEACREGNASACSNLKLIK